MIVDVHTHLMWYPEHIGEEYGVTDKLLLGSDFPSATVDHVIEGLRRVNDVVDGTRLPRVPEEAMASMIHHNWQRALPELG